MATSTEATRSFSLWRNSNDSLRTWK